VKQKVTNPKDGVVFSSCKILDLDDAVGEVVNTRHGWQSLKTSISESDDHS
jgi:hypothetical protein